MGLERIRPTLIAFAVAAVSACAGPTGLGDTGSSPLGPEAPLPPGMPAGEGLCALPLPPEGCQDTPTLPFSPGR